MVAARPPRRRRRRPPEQAVDAHLVRTAALVLIPAIVIALLAISTPGVLPRPLAAPAFDAASAASLAAELSSAYPLRVPGTPEAALAAAWYRQTMAALGLPTEERVWRERLPGLGTIELRNVITVVRGRSPQAIVVVAHRDNGLQGEGDNASGTATLLELARAYGGLGQARPTVPQRTLILVSTDGGAWGGVGAARYAEEVAREHEVVAAVVLSGLAQPGRPQLVLGAGATAAPARTLVRTAVARIVEHAGITPELPSALEQLVGLGIPFALGEQAAFLARGMAALAITGGSGAGASPGETQPRGEALSGLGRATEALVGSLDASPQRSFSTSDALFIGDRVVSGWALRMLLVVSVAPFALGIVDLVARARRRRLPFRPALRALARRVAFWGYVGGILWLGALLGALPSAAALPLPPAVAGELSWSPIGVTLLLGAIAVGWVIARSRLVSARRASPEEELAGEAVALAWLGAVALGAALIRPYALMFLLPSLYAWLWRPRARARCPRLALLGLGLVGPIAGIVVLARELELAPLATARYVAELAAIGYVPTSSVLLALGWAVAATQLGAIALGRYRPCDRAREPRWRTLASDARDRARRRRQASGR